MFLFKKSPIVLDCFTAQPHAHKFAPPHSAMRALPGWWKALPSISNKFKFDEEYSQTNMRYCAGMIDLYRAAVALPMWSDIDVLVGGEDSPGYRYQFADMVSAAGQHPSSQHEGFAPNKQVQHLKFESPWMFVTKESLNWVAVPASYNHDIADYQALPGVVNFKHSHTTSVQLMFSRAKVGPKNVHIAHRTPLYLYIPQTDREVLVRTHLVSHEEIRKLITPSFSRIRKGINEARLISGPQRCPIHNQKNSGE